ncbi:MAG: hypothetical protein KKE37_02690 [Verrucomicrobia bacterium]|nr:hypothetical protein [Verrucomicrobiota bacterium]MBU4428243.1 hypothetical protein [Verrucomicrobiota bacterium]MCG2679542.1 hypothetical protein [Kiritimatiellia bacterium]
MKVESIGDTKQRVRRQLASLPFTRKLDALICLQRTARDMARASGRPFGGVVWPARRNERYGKA